jgi:hypothetical protein
LATIGYAHLPVPAGGDAPGGPPALAALATALDPHLVQHVDDLADRTATLSGAARGAVAVAADGTTWVKTAADSDTWATLWEPLPAWRPLSPAAGFQAGTMQPQVRVYGGKVYTRGRIIKIDGTAIDGTNGLTLATVPDDCVPENPATGSAYYSLTGDPLIGAGRYEVRPQGDPNVGQLVFYSQDGAQDGGDVGTPWVDISSDYWLD